MLKKICAKCKQKKSIEEFHKKTIIRKGSKKIGRKPRCKVCDKEDQQIYKKKYKLRLAVRDKKYYQENKEYKSKVNKEYVKNNRDKRNKYIRQYKKNKRINDPNYKLYENTRKRIFACIKKKSHSSKELIGCSINFYRMWLEYTFEGEISWNNYGSIWHIDHVTPCSKFDLLNTLEQKKAFSWSNTRAMLILDNLKKSNKIIIDIIIKHYKQIMQFEKIVRFKQDLQWAIRIQASKKLDEGSTTR